MLGGKNRQLLGYTIVEVMIVLAVSGFMFLIAAQFVNGKQQRIVFTTSLNRTATSIQYVLQQVSDGLYVDSPVSCSFSYVPGPGIGTTTESTGPYGVVNQGTNSKCVFVGKLLRFHHLSPSYSVITLVGGRLDPKKLPPSVTPQQELSISDPINADSFRDDRGIAQAIQMVKMCVTGVDGITYTNNDSIGFAQSPGLVYNGAWQSGAQNVELIFSTIPDTSPNSAVNGSNVAFAKNATIIISDGTLTGAIDIGGTSNQLNVNVRSLDTGATCS